MLNIYYPQQLEEILIKKKKFIPKLCFNNEPLKKYHLYYCYDFNKSCYFKVYDNFDVDDIEYYCLEFLDNIRWSLSCPLLANNIYELVYDKHNIYDLNNIFEYNDYLKGYEIIYWFYINRNNIENKYKNYLLSYIEDGGNNKINNFLYYKFEIVNGRYIITKKNKI